MTTNNQTGVSKMETNESRTDDPFADTSGDDPFADSSPEPDLTEPTDEIAAEPVGFEQAGAPETELPVVDREGNPVAGPLETTPEDREEAPVEGEQEGAPVEPQPSAQETPTEAPQAAQEGPQAPAEGSEQAEAQAPQPTPQAPVAEAPTAPDPAPEPEPQPESNGKSPLRHYKVLYQTGPTTWEEADLKAAKDSGDTNVVVLTDDEGKNPELWLAARNNEHAVRLSWGILGTPQGGVTTFPVPRGAWKPRRIKPAPPKPERERLVIS